MNIGILGVGGVGSLIASRLSFTKHKVFCLGSVKSNKHIEKNGIIIKSNFYGNSKFYPDILDKETILDYVFITVKGTNLKEALLDYQNFFTKNTIAISLLNGIGARELIRKNSKLNLIVGSIGELEVFLNSQRLAIHKSKKRPKIELACSDNNLNEEINLINEILLNIDIYSEIKENEDLVIWRKLSRLSIISTITSIYDSSIGFARDNIYSKEIMIKLIDEIYLITLKIGIKIDRKRLLTEIQSLPYNLKTSMQRDISSKKPSEIDFILKGPLEFGKKEGLRLSTMEYCYAVLLDKIKKGDIYGN